jgi:DNA-directed RNA polymerase specialized sigma24 family protein
LTAPPPVITASLVARVKELIRAGQAPAAVAKITGATLYLVRIIALAPEPARRKPRRAEVKSAPAHRRKSPSTITPEIRTAALALLGEGYSQREAAAELGIAQKSVSRIYRARSTEN